jgi:hypothetical protein
MTDLRKAAEQALEALRYTTDHLPAKTGVEREVDDAITALQVALVRPEWVGLTKRDLEGYSPELKTVLEYIEAILKRKNT